MALTADEKAQFEALQAKANEPEPEQPKFRNVYDVLEFVVHHLPTGFVDQAERDLAMEVVRRNNPDIPKESAEATDES